MVVAFIILGALLGGVVGMGVGAALPTPGCDVDPMCGLQQAGNAITGGFVGLLVGIVLGPIVGLLLMERRDRKRQQESGGEQMTLSRRAFVIWVASAASAVILGALLGALGGLLMLEVLVPGFGTGGFEDFGYAVLGGFVGLLIGTVLGATVARRLKRRWLGMSWSSTRARLERAFDAVATEVGSRFPAVTGSTGSWAAGYMRFHVGASFTHPAHTEREDVVLQFACAPNGSMRPGPGATPFFPEATGRDIVRFDIERGTGEELAALDPLLLPADPRAAEYERAVRKYVKRTIVFLQEHKELVFDVLRQAH